MKYAKRKENCDPDASHSNRCKEMIDGNKRETFGKRIYDYIMNICEEYKWKHEGAEN